MRRVAAVLFGLALGCGSAVDPTPVDGGSIDGGDLDGGADAGDADPSEVDFLTRLSTPDDLAALTSTSAAGVKYLASVAGRAPPQPFTEACYFQNMRRYSWHLLFLRSFEAHAQLSYDAYLGMVLRRASRALWGGGIQFWPGSTHPVSGGLGVVAYAVYGEPGSVDVAAITEVDRTLSACAPFAADLLVFVPDSPDQRGLLMRERDNLLAAGVASLFPEDLVASLPHLAYGLGEAYGTLKIVPEGQALGSYGRRDVVIVEDAPSAVSTLAALITKSAQDELGDLATGLRQRGIPNAAVPRIYESNWARALEGHLVRVVVESGRFVLEPARSSDAEAFWAAHPERS